MLKAGVYDPYLDTLGGGERYCLSVVEVLLKNNYNVDIFWSGDQDILPKAEKRFGLELSAANLVPDIFQEHPHQIECVENQEILSSIASRRFTSDDRITKIKKIVNKIKITRQYDVFFYISDWSIPFLFSHNNLLHIQLPLAKSIPLSQKIINKIKLYNYNKILCNSEFTLNVAKPRLGSKCTVLYPPVDTKQFNPSGPKENIILSVGRFDTLFNSKKQEVLIEAFKKMYDQKNILGWKLVLAGGVLNHMEENSFLIRLKEMASGYPIEFQINPDFTILKSIYESSKIYWHAAGYNVDEDLHPENTEHFGIAPVEAMASGAVPILVKKGGLGEIVTDGVSGYLWNTTEELVAKTQLLIGSPETMSQISQKSIEVASKYSKESFENNFKSILNI